VRYTLDFGLITTSPKKEEQVAPAEQVQRCKARIEFQSLKVVPSTIVLVMGVPTSGWMSVKQCPPPRVALPAKPWVLQPTSCSNQIAYHQLCFYRYF
jgi:hypothetical protein